MLFQKTILLFALNLLDGILTIVWVRSGIATEGNHLMAQLLDIGDFTFLGVKIAIGLATAIVILNWGHLRLARYGLGLALGVYIGLMGIHLFTGLSAFGIVSSNFLHDIAQFSKSVFALFI